VVDLTNQVVDDDDISATDSPSDFCTLEKASIDHFQAVSF
jgi:hypothetical protein